MRFGNSDPDSADYDSLADYYIDDTTGVMEIRIPWLLLNFKDPSSKEIFGDIYSDGMTSRQVIEDIGIALVMTDNNGKVTQTFPGTGNDRQEISVEEVSRYKWEPWELPFYEEDRITLPFLIQETFNNTP
jgi:hypothetical protein